MRVQIVLACVLAASLCVAQPARLHPIKVGIDLWPGYYPIIIAKQKGYFEQQGLDVSYILPEETNNLMTMFTNKQIDMLCVAMGDAFVLYDQDPDMRVVMITDESQGGDALLTKSELPPAGHPIKIGTNLKGFGELFVRRFIDQSRYKKNDIIWVQQEASQAMEFLRTNKADIVHTWEPYVSEVSKFFGANIIFDSSQTPGLIPDALLVNGLFIKTHPELVKRFIVAWLQGASWWLGNRAEGDEMISAQLLLLPGTLSLKGTKLFTLAENQSVFRDGSDMTSVYYVAQLYLEYFKQKQAFMRLPSDAHGIITGEFLPSP